jgi:hypothetical protein
MLAKEKGTYASSRKRRERSEVRNAKANSSKNKRSFTGDSKAGKKNSPPGDNLLLFILCQ